MKEEVWMAALAGLLHDIGKFSQRAGKQGEEAWLTGQFIQEYLPGPFKQNGVLDQYLQAPAKDGLIKRAAELAAGGNPDKADGKNQASQLLSIFSSIFTNSSPANLYLPLKKMYLSKESIFPQAALPDDQARRAYQAMWKDFCNEALALKQAHESAPNLEIYIESVLALMQRYTSNIPSASYQGRANMSLYDHSRMTAALAAILSVDPNGQDGKAALLVGGDISGVQDFIYTITAKGAAKTLRGRSFYLQLLTEAALRFVLGRLNLPYTNVIYSGGGNFFLLVPPSAAQELPNVRAELSRILLKHHGTALYLALGFSAIPGEGFNSGRLPEFWDGMFQALNRAKQQRYIELGDGLQQVFQPGIFGGNPDETCKVCGNDRLKLVSLDKTAGTPDICSFCDSFKEIGDNLPNNNFVALGMDSPGAREPGTAASALEELGLQFQFRKDSEQVTLKAGRLAIWAMDDVNNGWPSANIPAAHFQHYVTRQVPKDTLDELQDQVEGGFQKLGVIRMDVDNVGDLFKHGLGNLASLARIAALSSQMSLFFEGWLKEICARDGRNKLIYTVYSGGDDAFLIGPWDRMPGLAVDIRSSFAEYTGSHPKISLSAGMSFIGGKYPIYQAADDAGEALETAKHAGKDAFYFLGGSWKWSTFELVEQKFRRISSIVDEMEGPQAIIHILRDLAEQKSRKQKGHHSREMWGPWQWRGAYLLTRMKERHESKKELAQAIGAVRDDLENNNYSELNQWGTAARWAQLKNREKTEREQKK